MRTTLDLPDELYRSLKVRAALEGVPLRQLVHRLIEQGLRTASPGGGVGSRPAPPPVIVPSRGAPIAPLSRVALHRIEEEEDEARDGRSA